MNKMKQTKANTIESNEVQKWDKIGQNRIESNESNPWFTGRCCCKCPRCHFPSILVAYPFFCNNSAIVTSDDGSPPSEVGENTPGKAPVRIGYLPVSIPALDGVQTGWGAYQEVKSMPSVANRSIFGVPGGGHWEYDLPYFTASFGGMVMLFLHSRLYTETSPIPVSSARIMMKLTSFFAAFTPSAWCNGCANNNFAMAA